MSWTDVVVRYAVFVLVTVAGVALLWAAFVAFPGSLAQLLGVVLFAGLVPLVLRFASSAARSAAAPYNVAEVSVTGPIRRSGGGSGPLSAAPTGTTADAVVDQVERADADGSVEALLVRLNTPGGEIIPSEDIKLAVERFEGPVVAQVVDTCASGGYEVASGCDEVWAREGSVVGSIGVIGSRVNASELADDLGISYEQFTAGKYKDAGTPLKELEPDERAYLQDIVDGYYDQFVEGIAERREIDPAEIRDTEARIYLGRRAHDLGLVDELGTRRDIEDRLSQLLGEQPVVESFEPRRPLPTRLRTGARQLAYAFGAGLTGTVRQDGDRFRFR